MISTFFCFNKMLNSYHVFNKKEGKEIQYMFYDPHHPRPLFELPDMVHFKVDDPHLINIGLNFDLSKKYSKSFCSNPYFSFSILFRVMSVSCFAEAI